MTSICANNIYNYTGRIGCKKRENVIDHTHIHTDATHARTRTDILHVYVGVYYPQEANYFLARLDEQHLPRKKGVVQNAICGQETPVSLLTIKNTENAQCHQTHKRSYKALSKIIRHTLDKLTMKKGMGVFN